MAPGWFSLKVWRSLAGGPQSINALFPTLMMRRLGQSENRFGRTGSGFVHQNGGRKEVSP